MRVPQISDLSHEVRIKQHILCHQVPKDDLRTVFVQVEKALRHMHVLQNGSLQHWRDVGNCFNQIVEIPIQSLHQQHRELTVGEETNTQEQRDVGVMKVRHQLAFLYILASNIFHPNID